jgi:hypothetical protein
MCKVREVYYYDVSKGNYKKTPVAPIDASLDKILSTTCNITNHVFILKDKNGKQVGSYVSDGKTTTFSNYEIGKKEVALIFNNNNNVVLSYVLYPFVAETINSNIKENTTVHAKSIAVGGKYSGKEVTVTVKTDQTTVRKIILEYDK